MYEQSRKGERYGRLTVREIDDRKGEREWYWCECDCGRWRPVILWRLLKGDVTECVPCDRRRGAGLPVFEALCRCGRSAVWMRGELKLCEGCFRREYGGV